LNRQAALINDSHHDRASGGEPSGVTSLGQDRAPTTDKPVIEVSAGQAALGSNRTPL
jgi:hypothetical protein